MIWKKWNTILQLKENGKIKQNGNAIFNKKQGLLL